METKNDRFIRLGEARANSVINKLRLIGNLSNTRNYEYSKKEVDELFKAIESELKNTKKLFDIELSKQKNEFKFIK